MGWVRGPRAAVLTIVACLVLGGRPSRAEEPATDGAYHTPLAGEPLETEVLGKKVEVPARDRSSVIAALLGAGLHSPRVDNHRTDYFAAFYVRRFWETRFLRATLAGFANEAEYAERFGPFEAVGRAVTYTLPGGRTEVIDDEEIKPDRVKYGRVTGELGLGYRTATAPGAVDNELRADLFYEASWVYVRRSRDTGTNVRLPPDTLEHGVHLRGLWDGMRRNLLELPHEGLAAGGDVELVHRDRWATTRFTTITYERGDARDYLKASAYAVWATGLPFLSERHRFVLSLHGGWSPPRDLDRFSAFRLGSGPLATESYDLSRRPIPGLMAEQLRVRDYAVGCVEYRFEPLFFLYLHFRWTGAFLNHLTLSDDGSARYVRQLGHSLSTAVSSGFLFSSSIYLEYAFSTAQLRGRDGHSVLFVITKAF